MKIAICDDVIEEQNERLEYYSYDNISAMFKEYLSKFIDKKDWALWRKLDL